MVLPTEQTQSADFSNTLVVLLHAYTNTADSMSDVEKIVRSTLHLAEVIKPDLPFQMFSSADLCHQVLTVLAQIDAKYKEGRYTRIILVGHSVGALLARKVYVAACGPTGDAPFSDMPGVDAPRPWAECVKRIILLAGMNRGWTISHHLSLSRAIVLRLACWVGSVVTLFRGRPLVIFQVRRGAPFLTQLRLQWLAMKKHARSRRIGDALTIQLLGTIDDLVSPEDNIDLVSGRDFLYFDVGKTDHGNIIEMVSGGYTPCLQRIWDSLIPQPEKAIKIGTDRKGEPRNPEANCQLRANIFADALKLKPKELKEKAAKVSDQPIARVRRQVTDVIFVVHGIRDAGYWTQRVARHVITYARDQQQSTLHTQRRIFEMQTSSYGYFPMGPFLFASRRREKVEWLMNQYAEAMATYPNARFSCVAHSNGTYLIAKALELYPACRFTRIVFAGSVVRRGFEWRRYLGRQVEHVLNYAAQGDWVVAWFPKLFEFLRIQDLGSAGFDGFRPESLADRWQVRFINGGHGAALSEDHWNDIAAFVVSPDPPVPNTETDASDALINLVGLFPPILWALLAAVVVFAGISLWVVLPNDIFRTAGLILYGRIVWMMLTRF
jgi:pimeloyl-ACP methyl ester carboxylesterase